MEMNGGRITKLSSNLEMMIGGRRGREDEQEVSRSGSDNLEAFASGDDADHLPPTKKRYHRHTPHQIQELEGLFKECPHPDEKQRLELSRRLSLETRQVKFWFQNRRTQMKTQMERHENSILRQENDKLRAENMSIREAMRNPICSNCGSPTMMDEVTMEEHQLRVENARLKEELDRVCTIAGKFLTPAASSTTLPPPGLELGVGNNHFSFGSEILTPIHPERPMLLELAMAAMDELLRMAEGGGSLWVRAGEGGGELLNREEYVKLFSSNGMRHKPSGFVSEASRECGIAVISSTALVETMMDACRWRDMFPCVVATSSTTEVIVAGVDGSMDGALQLMRAELQMLSPFVDVRQVEFLRFCKQQGEGIWAVVDISVDILHHSSPTSFTNCRRHPSGCLLRDIPNGYSKVTWVEHADYDEAGIHHLYRPLVSSGMGFGARRWLASLQTQSHSLSLLHSTALTVSGQRSMLKLAQRMTRSFCAGVSPSSAHKWSKLAAGEVRMMTRKSVDDPGEPPGVVASASTSLWLPLPPQRLFDFLRDETFRCEWDIMSNGGPVQEMAHISKGHDNGNSISLLRATAMEADKGGGGMLILQETRTDGVVSMVVYAPVDIPAMNLVMSGGDSAYVAMLPSGFAVAEDGKVGGGGGGGGSLLTVGFQVLVNEKLTVESVVTVSNLVSCTLEKIKSALGCSCCCCYE